MLRLLIVELLLGTIILFLMTTENPGMIAEKYGKKALYLHAKKACDTYPPKKVEDMVNRLLAEGKGDYKIGSFLAKVNSELKKDIYLELTVVGGRDLPDAKDIKKGIVLGFGTDPNIPDKTDSPIALALETDTTLLFRPGHRYKTQAERWPEKARFPVTNHTPDLDSVQHIEEYSETEMYHFLSKMCMLDNDFRTKLETRNIPDHIPFIFKGRITYIDKASYYDSNLPKGSTWPKFDKGYIENKEDPSGKDKKGFAFEISIEPIVKLEGHRIKGKVEPGKYSRPNIAIFGDKEKDDIRKSQNSIKEIREMLCPDPKKRPIVALFVAEKSSGKKKWPNPAFKPDINDHKKDRYYWVFTILAIYSLPFDEQQQFEFKIPDDQSDEDIAAEYESVQQREEEIRKEAGGQGEYQEWSRCNVCLKNDYISKSSGCCATCDGKTDTTEPQTQENQEQQEQIPKWKKIVIMNQKVYKWTYSFDELNDAGVFDVLDKEKDEIPTEEQFNEFCTEEKAKLEKNK
jgi:hypothetical protein